MKQMNEQVKLIFTGKVARALLRKGFQIIDVKPNKDFPERTVFVFKDVFGLKEEVQRLSSM